MSRLAAPRASCRVPVEPVRRTLIGPWRVELLPRGPYRASYVATRPIIGFAFDPQVGVHAFGGDRRTGYRARPNGLARVPVGCDVYSRSETGGEYLRIVDARDDGGRETGEDGDGGGGAGRDARFGDRIDPPGIAAAHALRRELLASDAPDPLACESLVLALEARAAAVAGRPAERASGCMTPRRLALVDELIEARLDGPLAVHELADALGLSAGFFARAFKAGTGRTPHAWIVERRLARARALLLRGDAGLARVAAECGFASHSHLTASFRARFGAVPSDFRRRVRAPRPIDVADAVSAPGGCRASP